MLVGGKWYELTLSDRPLAVCGAGHGEDVLTRECRLASGSCGGHTGDRTQWAWNRENPWGYREATT